MPLCHNLIEAMSVGCIPILQHGHLLNPPLQNGVDCLSFDSEDELLDVLDRVPSFTAAEVEGMRRNVAAYYQAHLTPTAVIGELERRRATLRSLRMNAEWPSTKILLDRIRAKGLAK